MRRSFIVQLEDADFGPSCCYRSLFCVNADSRMQTCNSACAILGSNPGDSCSRPFSASGNDGEMLNEGVACHFELLSTADVSNGGMKTSNAYPGGSKLSGETGARETNNDGHEVHLTSARDRQANV